MKTKYNGKHPFADYEKIIPEYFGDVSNSVQIPGNDMLQVLKKELLFDSILTETGKNFPEVKGLENDELWVEMVTAVVDKHAVKEKNCEDLENDTIVMALGSQEDLHGKVRSFKKISIGYLAAALILLSVVSVSIFVKMNQSESGVTLTSEFEPKVDSVRVSDLINAPENKNLNKNEQCDVIGLDSGSLAFVDSGALVSDVKIGDKMVSVRILKGAVSFSVAKKKQRSFVVNAGLADIVVTGTRFRVMRMDSVVTVAVNNGSVNTLYNNGAGKAILTGGQVAIVMKDTIAVLNNDSMPDLPERILLTNFLETYGDLDEEHASISKRTADSLLEIMFTSGLAFATEGDLIENFSCILESKGRYEDALTVLQHHPEYSSKQTSNVIVRKLRSELLLKNGDTAAAVALLENSINNQQNLNNRCDALSKLYRLHVKGHNIPGADTCLHQYTDCTQKMDGMDKVIIDHAHLLRNTSMIDEALYWYEYILENFADSKYRKDAEYWISDCIIQKSIEKNSALKNKSTSSGR